MSQNIKNHNNNYEWSIVIILYHGCVWWFPPEYITISESAMLLVHAWQLKKYMCFVFYLSPGVPVQLWNPSQKSTLPGTQTQELEQRSQPLVYGQMWKNEVKSKQLCTLASNYSDIYVNFLGEWHLSCSTVIGLWSQRILHQKCTSWRVCHKQEGTGEVNTLRTEANLIVPIEVNHIFFLYDIYETVFILRWCCSRMLTKLFMFNSLQHKPAPLWSGVDLAVPNAKT